MLLSNKRGRPRHHQPLRSMWMKSLVGGLQSKGTKERITFGVKTRGLRIKLLKIGKQPKEVLGTQLKVRTILGTQLKVRMPMPGTPFKVRTAPPGTQLKVRTAMPGTRPKVRTATPGTWPKVRTATPG